MDINYELLKEYKPKDDMFTSVEEMKLIEENLVNNKNLKELTPNELIDVRNEVVLFYTKQGQFSMESLQSVTAVIDNIYYRM